MSEVAPPNRVSDIDWAKIRDKADAETIPVELSHEPPQDRVPCTAAELGLPEQMDGDGPLVSVVIPTYEDQLYLPDALESVGYQSYTNLELILIDSSGVEWLERLATDRPWIRYCSQEPVGISAARNEAIELAHGRYIALLDADDYWHPAKLERQVTALESCEKTLSYTAYYRLDFRNEQRTLHTHDMRRADPDRAWLDRIRERFIAIPSTLVFRQSAVPQRPFDESLAACEDQAFLIDRFLEESPVHVADPLTVKRARPGQMTDDMKNIYEQKIASIDTLIERHRSLPDVRRALVYWKQRTERSFGEWARDVGELRLARQHFAEAEFIFGSRRLDEGDIDGAQQHFERAVSQIPDGSKGQMHRRIAWEYFDTHKKLAAVHFIDSVLH